MSVLTLFTDFGLMLGTLPASARFEILHKGQSNSGAGRGSAKPGPTQWSQLRKHLDTLAYIRNATAHADVGKLETCPSAAEGDVWLKTVDGAWSVQQPHGLTAVRSVLSIFNTTAEALHGTLGQRSQLALTVPGKIQYPAASKK